MSELHERPPAVTSEERRRYVRLRKEVRLTCHIMEEKSKVADISTRNVSLGGLLIALRREVQVSAMLNLHFSLESGMVEVMVPGRVVWAEYNGITGQFEAGVMLVGMDAQHRQNIMSLMGKSLGSEGIERRHYIRLQRRLLVEYRPAGGILRRKHTGHTRDISVGGMGLHTAQEIKPGSGVSMRVHFDDGGAPVQIEGSVLESRECREEPGGGNLIAVHFTHMDDASHVRLSAYITRTLNSEVILPGKGVRVWAKHAKKPKEKGADTA
jgi:c-di-GMP-binding flagellar brake protein YcgR